MRLFPEHTDKGRERARTLKFSRNKDSLTVLGLVSLEKRSFFEPLMAGLSMWRGLEPRGSLGRPCDMALRCEKNSSRASGNRDSKRVPFWKDSHAPKNASWPIIPTGLPWLVSSLQMFSFPRTNKMSTDPVLKIYSFRDDKAWNPRGTGAAQVSLRARWFSSQKHR